MSDKNLYITLVHSTTGFNKEQKAAARQLRLTKLHKTTEWPDSPSVRGQIRKIAHLVKVREA